ncbi:MAG: DUF4339 domain-containing protein [Prevotella sp.]
MNDNSYFSIDRLVEFGMGMAMAQQMVQVMNQSMKQMYVPGSMQSMPTSQSPTFYVAIDGQSVGPITECEFTHLVTDKKVTKDSLAWMPGMLGWQPIEKIPAILKIIAIAPPPIPQKR